MSVTFDVATASGNFAGGTSKTFNHAAGSPDLAVIHVAWVKFPSGTNTASVTYGGTGTTQCRAVGTVVTSAGNGYTHSFYLASPASGTQSVVITFSNTSNYGQGGVTTWTGANTSSPIAGTSEATGTSSAPTVAIGSTSGNYCIDTLLANGVTPTATLTQNWVVNDSGIRGASQRTASTGSSINMAWTGSVNQWVIQAYEIAAAGGGGTANSWYYRAQQGIAA